MKKIITLALCFLLGMAAMNADAQPNFDNGYSAQGFTNHVVFYYSYDSATPLPMRIRITLADQTTHALVTDSIFTDTQKSNSHALYITPAPPPPTYYDVTFYLVDTQTNSNIIYGLVSTGMFTGILSPEANPIRMWCSGRTLYAPIEDKPLTVSVTDISGREVIRSSDEVTDLTSLTAGVYVAIRRMQDGRVFTRKILLE